LVDKKIRLIRQTNMLKRWLERERERNGFFVLFGRASKKYSF
jgi:hypothetical protein